MKSTRELVLKTLLDQQRCTINDLADAVDIHPISVRHHIAKLEADGLVDSEEERHGVGRPRRVYFLTPTGIERFPTRYVQMSIRLIEQVKQYMPKPAVERLFAQMAQDLIAEGANKREIDKLGFEERLDLVQDLLVNEGFEVDWVKNGDEYHIRETNCPYLQVGQNHPEVCAMDQTIISNVLSVPAEKVRCILDGDAHCTYVIPASAISERR